MVVAFFRAQEVVRPESLKVHEVTPLVAKAGDAVFTSGIDRAVAAGPELHALIRSTCFDPEPPRDHPEMVDDMGVAMPWHLLSRSKGCIEDP